MIIGTSNLSSWVRMTIAVAWSGLHLGEGLFRPRDDDLRGARQPLRGREAGPRVGDDRPPADLLRRAAERLGGVDRAVDQQSRGRPVDVGEDLAAGDLDDAAPSSADELRRRLGELLRRLADALAVLRDEQLGTQVVACEHRQHHGALTALDDLHQPLGERPPRFLHEDVDLAAARQADAQRQVVRDPVREEPRRPAGKHFLRVLVHLVLDAPAGHGAGELALRRDRELGADRPRRRAPRRDDGRERDAVSACEPALDVVSDLAHAEILRRGPTVGACSGCRSDKVARGRVHRLAGRARDRHRRRRGGRRRS